MLRFLIADDFEIVRRGLKQILLESFPSAYIEEADNSTTLFTKAVVDHWDIVITDLSMPGGSGLDALKEIRKKKPQLPVLVISFHPEEQYAAPSILAGAQGYLNKNSIPDELVKTVKIILSETG